MLSRMFPSSQVIFMYAFSRIFGCLMLVSAECRMQNAECSLLFTMVTARVFFRAVFFLFFQDPKVTIYTFRKKDITREYFGSSSLQRRVRLDFFQGCSFFLIAELHSAFCILHSTQLRWGGPGRFKYFDYLKGPRE